MTVQRIEESGIGTVYVMLIKLLYAMEVQSSPVNKYMIIFDNIFLYVDGWHMDICVNKLNNCKITTF